MTQVDGSYSGEVKIECLFFCFSINDLNVSGEGGSSDSKSD